MGYYHIPLTEEASKLCTTILPWGKYCYKRLPMGIKNATDIFQNVMMELLGDLPYIRVYLDDILITTKDTYEDHMDKLHEVLTRLEQAGFRANLRKCFFAEDKLDYLGYWITRTGIQPQPKKVEAIRRLNPPTNKRQLRRFLGMINYYRDMWRRRSHILAPLTALQSNTVKWQWNTEEQSAFDEIKRIIQRETILAFPDFSKPFHIHTDSSCAQLGSVITQSDKPIAFYSRKMNDAQKRYPTGEQELLSIVETLKEFKNILLGQDVIIHTDHKNLLYEKSCSDRIIRLRLLIEEYAPTFIHIKGEKNVVADALSRLDADFSEILNDQPTKQEQATTYVTSEDLTEYEFPLSGKSFHKYQQKDKMLLKTSKGPNAKHYSTKLIEGVPVIMYHEKVCVPLALQQRIVEWFHEYLRHPGEVRTEETIRRTMVWPNLRVHVRKYCKTCKKCQLCKKSRKHYGHLPPKEEISVTPWERVDIDLIGPYKVKSNDGKKYVLRALTMIDPATRWFEVVRIRHPTAKETMEALDNTWLCRYPRPTYIGFDNGSEFKNVFKTLCDDYGLRPKPSTAYNPQGNSMIERIHLTLGNMLRTFELDKQVLNPKDPFSMFLNSAAWALRSTYHTVLNATPGQIVFNRDMLLPIDFKADWAHIIREKEQIQKDNLRENNKRLAHTYKVGDKVLITKPGKVSKLSPPRRGPYEIISVYTNGTVRVRRGAVSSRINIRRITPYFTSTDREANDMR